MRNPSDCTLLTHGCIRIALTMPETRTNVSDTDNDSRYQDILQKFENEIESKQVIVHREFSQNTCKFLEHNYFDWIYVDGVHSYVRSQSGFAGFSYKSKAEWIYHGA